MKDDTKDLLLIAGVGISALWLYSKREEIELPEFPAFGMPEIDLSGLFEGLQFPSFDIGKLGGGGWLGGLGVPKLDLANLGLGLVPPSIPEIPKIPDIPELIKDVLGIGKGEGERDVTIAPEPSEQTWSDVVKGFVSEHPYITAAVAVPATTALSYGFIKTVPYVAPAVGAAGKAIVSGASKLSSNVYNVVKLPKGLTIWKPVIKGVAAKGVAAKGIGLGAGGITALFFGGLAGATELSRLVGWKPEMVANLPPILKQITQAIVWLSPAETARGFISPVKAGAATTKAIVRIKGLEQYQGEYYEAGIAPPKGYYSGGEFYEPVVPSGYTEAPIAPAPKETREEESMRYGIA